MVSACVRIGGCLRIRTIFYLLFVLGDASEYARFFIFCSYWGMPQNTHDFLFFVRIGGCLRSTICYCPVVLGEFLFLLGPVFASSACPAFLLCLYAMSKFFSCGNYYTHCYWSSCLFLLSCLLLVTLLLLTLMSYSCSCSSSSFILLTSTVTIINTPSSSCYLLFPELQPANVDLMAPLRRTSKS